MLALNNLAVAYHRRVVVEHMSLALAKGEIGCLLGASGCGKTSVLRAIAGFEPAYAGEVHLHGEKVSTAGYTLAPEKRRIGMVFQDFALFPHLTVAENIAFGLRTLPKRAQQERVNELLELVELQALGGRYSHALSGGQQQRVALARALAAKPDLLLMDEPFSSLDTELRESLACQIRAILKRQDIAALLVTHDKTEAFTMADKIGVMDKGRLLQWDKPVTLFDRPASIEVAEFISKATRIRVQHSKRQRISGSIGNWPLPQPLSAAPDAELHLLLRPHQVKPCDDGALKGKVIRQVFRGNDYLCEVELANGEQLYCQAPLHLNLTVGQEIGLLLDLQQPWLFDIATGARVV
ncbi:ABC transporter ATP-binding protein [Bowmanella denitrificans]|uniref:ABC transporter ATP-binding protein n=1 Tax=Bowmanella denitrificans TaxID=366582 RepID=A0ABN0X0G6_9ALTE